MPEPPQKKGEAFICVAISIHLMRLHGAGMFPEEGKPFICVGTLEHLMRLHGVGAASKGMQTIHVCSNLEYI